MIAPGYLSNDRSSMDPATCSMPRFSNSARFHCNPPLRVDAMCLRGRVGQGLMAAVRRSSELPQGRLPILWFTQLSSQVLQSHILLVSYSADFDMPPKAVNPCRVRPLSCVRSFHMLQPEIIEVCDGIGFRP